MSSYNRNNSSDEITTGEGAVSLYSPRRLSSFSSSNRRSSITNNNNEGAFAIATTIITSLISSSFSDQSKRSSFQQRRRKSSTIYEARAPRQLLNITTTSDNNHCSKRTTTSRIILSSISITLAGYFIQKKYYKEHNNQRKGQGQTNKKEQLVVNENSVETKTNNNKYRTIDILLNTIGTEEKTIRFIFKKLPLFSWIYNFFVKYYNNTRTHQVVISLLQPLYKILQRLKEIKKQCFLSIDSNHSTFLLKDDNGDDDDDDKKIINDIIYYWFGQNQTNIQQRTLWMISDPKLKKEVDEHIYNKYYHILIQLSTCDKTRVRWCCNNMFGRNGHVACIIVLDQLTRHIHRYINEHNITNNVLPSMDVTDMLAKNLATEFQNIYKQDIISGQLPMNQFIFMLMPFRHGNDITVHELETNVLDKIELANEIYLKQNDILLKRFRNATTRRLNLLKDKQRRLGYSNSNTSSSSNSTAETTIVAKTKKTRTKTTPAKATTTTTTSNNNEEEEEEDNDENDAKILETFPFIPSDETIKTIATEHPLVLAVKEFLIEQCGIQLIVDESKKNKKPKKKQQHQQQHQQQQQQSKATKGMYATKPIKNDNTSSNDDDDVNNNPTTAIIVSLSGGVDSMTIVHVLSQMIHPNSPLYCLKNTLIFAAHVDYANRPESSDEASYLKKYCQQYLNNNVYIKIRRIEEVTRGITDRNEYEKISRNIRYDLYKQLISEDIPNVTGCSLTNINVIGVMLGHHCGDIRENVLSNSLKGCSPLDLSGMTYKSQIEGITILRPLLKLEKSTILNYAHTLGIPYFKDTTPSWSTRGKLRTHLLPLLKDIYGDGCMNNLTNLAIESDLAKELVNDKILKPFYNNVYKYPLGITFDVLEYKNYTLFFWKFVLKELMHSIGLGMWTDKSVMSFIERISSTKSTSSTSGWLQCRKDYGVYYNTQQEKVYVLYPISFPWSKQNQYYNTYSDIKGIYYPYETSTKQIGPWKIEVEQIFVQSDKEQQELLLQKAINNMDYFISTNEIIYYLKVPVITNITTTTAAAAAAATAAAYLPSSPPPPPPPPQDVQNTKKDSSTTISTTNSPPSLVFFQTITKQNRPLSWKLTDLKIQSTLPILTVEGVGASSSSLLSSSSFITLQQHHQEQQSDYNNVFSTTATAAPVAAAASVSVTTSTTIATVEGTTTTTRRRIDGSQTQQPVSSPSSSSSSSSSSSTSAAASSSSSSSFKEHDSNDNNNNDDDHHHPPTSAAATTPSTDHPTTTTNTSSSSTTTTTSTSTNAVMVNVEDDHEHPISSGSDEDDSWTTTASLPPKTTTTITSSRGEGTLVKKETRTTTTQQHDKTEQNDHDQEVEEHYHIVKVTMKLVSTTNT